MTCVVCLSRLGDVVNAIPIAHAAFKRTGEKVKWVVSLHFVGPLLGCSFVEPIKVQYAQDNITLGMQTAKETGATEILLAQCFGKHWKGDHSHAFNRQAWINCNMGDCFDRIKEYPLVFDRRDAEREQRLCERVLTGDKPIMLISLSCGKSSPFAAHYAFTYAIRRRWQDRFQIIDLCETRASRVYDLLALMERAAILITSDSLPIHLATAVQSLPVIFLANDQAFLASDTRCRVVLRLRYAEWHSRIAEVHAAIASTFGITGFPSQ